jgi:hypothetical protein
MENRKQQRFADFDEGQVIVGYVIFIIIISLQPLG